MRRVLLAGLGLVAASCAEAGCVDELAATRATLAEVRGQRQNFEDGAGVVIARLRALEDQIKKLERDKSILLDRLKGSEKPAP
jgi:hypothetical protein